MTLLLTMIGACVLMYKDGGFVRAEMWGSVLAVTSTVGAATYQVLLLSLCIASFPLKAIPFKYMGGGGDSTLLQT